ncbi:MAG: signal recognition particle receptor subunit alpha, partial [Acidobacteria bacterium]|nr:signal recognition particle receptor subunit alpha [Acidobacteriota bacterium]
MSSSEDRSSDASSQKTSGGTLGRLLRGLARTRDGLVDRLKDLVQAPARIDTDLLDQVEALLLLSDVGPTLTREVIQSLKQNASGRQIQAWPELVGMVRTEMKGILSSAKAATPQRPATGPEVILLVGVNGGGKTTTAGKLAARWAREGR